MVSDARERVLDELRRFTARQGVPSPGDRVLLAVSGGLDSVVLFDAFDRLREELGVELCVGHLDHLLRGEASAADAAHVAELAAARGIPCVVERVDIASMLGPSCGGKQGVARRQRYAFLNRLANAVGAQWIATGHQRDDQAETVLWRIVRGTGLKGLRGIPAVRGRYLRPLLGLWREELEAYAQWVGLVHREDASNLLTAYTRNRIRLEVLPALAAINPRVKQALVSLGQLAGQDEEYLQEQSLTAYRQLVSQRWGQKRLPRQKLGMLHPALASRVLMQALEHVRPAALAQLDQEAVDEVLKLVCATIPGGQVTWPGEILVTVGQEWVTLVLPEEALADQCVAIPGVTPLGRGMYLTARILPHPPMGLDAGRGVAYLDWGRVDLPLRVRSRQARDHFQPLGMPGSKRLQDYFIQAKVPAQARHRVPIVYSPQSLAWVAGLRLDDAFRVTDDTTQVLELRLREIPCLAGARS